RTARHDQIDAMTTRGRNDRNVIERIRRGFDVEYFQYIARGAEIDVDVVGSNIVEGPRRALLNPACVKLRAHHLGVDVAHRSRQEIGRREPEAVDESAYPNDVVGCNVRAFERRGVDCISMRMRIVRRGRTRAGKVEYPGAHAVERKQIYDQ